METLHPALQIEVFKYLPSRMLVRKGLVSRELQELSNHQYLIRQYPHIMLADKPVLLESVFFNLDIDLVPQLIKLTDQPKSELF